jgi:hypothetical protein
MHPSIPILTLVLAMGCAACATQGPASDGEHYFPVSRAVTSWGELQLSHRSLRFDAFDGEMKLHYVGTMPEVAGEELGGATVYRVTNAKRFFSRNREREAFCDEPPRWLLVNSRNGAPAWSDEIWVAVLTLENWAAYTPEQTGYCAGGMYVRSAR